MGFAAHTAELRTYHPHPKHSPPIARMKMNQTVRLLSKSSKNLSSSSICTTKPFRLGLGMRPPPRRIKSWRIVRGAPRSQPAPPRLGRVPPRFGEHLVRRRWPRDAALHAARPPRRGPAGALLFMAGQLNSERCATRATAPFAATPHPPFPPTPSHHTTGPRLFFGLPSPF